MSETFTDKKYLSFNQTIQKVANTYGVDAQQAKQLIAYHGKVRGELNSLYTQGQITDRFDPKAGIASETSGVAQDAVGAIPIIGGLIAAGVSIFRRAAYFFERKKTVDDLQSIQDINNTGDPREWFDFTRDIATRMMEAKTKEITQLESTSEARQMAKSNCKKVAQNMFNNKLIKDQDIIADREEMITRLTGIASKENTKNLDQVAFSSPPVDARYAQQLSSKREMMRDKVTIDPQAQQGQDSYKAG